MIFFSAKDCQQVWLFMCGDDGGRRRVLTMPTCCCSASKQNISVSQRRHMAREAAITCKWRRSCPQEELSSGAKASMGRWDVRCHGWILLPSTHFGYVLVATVHRWQHQRGVVMRSIDDRVGNGSRWHFRVPRSENIHLLCQSGLISVSVDFFRPHSGRLLKCRCRKLLAFYWSSFRLFIVD